MAVASQIEVEWGGGLRQPPLRRFALPNAQLSSLQEATGEGPAALLKRIGEGAALFNAVRETVRQGLIGGGMAPDDAETIVKAHIDPLAEAILLSRAILTAWSARVAGALVGYRTKNSGDGAAENSGTKIDLGKFWGAFCAAGGQKADFDAMDFADVIYGLEGYRKVHCADDRPEAPTAEDHRKLSAAIAAKIAQQSGVL